MAIDRARLQRNFIGGYPRRSVQGSLSLVSGWTPIIRAWGATRRGGGHERNEDAFCLLDSPVHTRYSTDRGVIVAVSDGVSTVAQGHWASQVSCNRLSGFFERNAEASSETLTQLISEIDWEIRGQREGSAACTLAVVWLCNDNAAVFQVGDSHVFHLRDGVISQITEGGLRAGAKLDHFLGMGPDVSEVIRISQPEIQAGDVLFLVTDGVTAELEPESFATMWSDARGDPATCSTAIMGAVSRANGQDDATAVVALIL